MFKRSKKAEEHAAAVAALQCRLDAIGRSQAVIEFKLDGTIIEANENFLAVMGYAAGDLRPASQSVHGPHRGGK